MGIVSSKGIPWPHGNIILQLNKMDYLPGEALQGVVHLQLQQSFPGDCIKIRFKGREFNYWQEGIGSNRRHYRHKIEIHNFEEFIYSWSSESIPPGQYSFPFEFLLSQDLAASFFYNGWDYMAMIWYSLKVYVGSKRGLKVPLLEHKHIIAIIQPMTIIEKQPIYERVRQINSCCCYGDAGPLLIRATIEKVVYVANEIVNVVFDLDASQCTNGCTSVYFVLKQELKLLSNISMYTINEKKFLVQKILPGIQPGQKILNQSISLQLPPAEPYHFEGTKAIKKITKNTINLNSTTTGKIVQCSYFIAINPIVNDCLGFIDNGLSIPIIINSSVFPPMNPIEAPPEWNPQIMDIRRLSYSPGMYQNFNTNLVGFDIQNQGMNMMGQMPNEYQMNNGNMINQEFNPNLYNNKTLEQPMIYNNNNNNNY